MKYPFWVRVFVMVLGAYRANKAMRNTPMIIPRENLKDLDGLFYSLPVVHGKILNWITQQVVGWIDRQKENLVILNSWGVEEVNMVENDL